MAALTRHACICLLTFLPLANVGTNAAASQPTESAVKAAFLMKFAHFVEWPVSAFPDPDSPIAICVSDSAPFGQELQQMVAGESVGQRKLVVVRSPSEPSKSCQMMFVDRGEKLTPKLLAEAGPNVLTVGESADFLASGGMINFVIDNHRVRFDINRKAVNRSAVKLSSRLFSVARSVRN